MKEMDENRINELISELSDCREDERSSQNLMVQVISTAGAILGIMLGCNVYSGLRNTNVLFFLSGFVFSTALPYITVLGIGNVLRYYYIQDLEDRLNILIGNTSDDAKKGKEFLHWNSFYSPVITRNIKHIKMPHGVVNYLCYTIATVCAIFFCIFLTAFQFTNIKNKKWYDIFFAVIIMLVIVSTSISFVYISTKAKCAAQEYQKIATGRRKLRKAGIKYEDKNDIIRFIGYLIYPKVQGIQKTFLIVAGFLMVLFLQKGSVQLGWREMKTLIPNLILAIIVFDVLAYQARYQINDIRGIAEDCGKENRLLTKQTKNAGLWIAVSLITACLKIVMSIAVILLFGYNMKKPLLFSLVCLVAVTFFYEFSRAKNITSMIYLFVGSGYPLRIIVGCIAACPDIYKRTAFESGISISENTKLFILLAFWAYGIFSGILPWVGEVVEHIQCIRSSHQNFSAVKFEKQHFMKIKDVIINRYRHVEAEQKLINGKVLPLRQKGEFWDVWNIAYLLSMAFLFWAFLEMEMSGWLIAIEILLLVINAAVCFFAKEAKIAIFMSAEWILIVWKGCIAFYNMAYVSICIMQILFSVTYFILRYIPQITKMRLMARKMFQKAVILLAGRLAGEIIISNWGQRRKK